MLTKAQKEEVLDLMAEGLDGRLSPEKEARLRVLVGHELPREANAPWEKLHEAAAYMVGVWNFTGSLEAEA